MKWREAMEDRAKGTSIHSGSDRRRRLLKTRPNILILMVDQLNGTLFPTGPPTGCTFQT